MSTFIEIITRSQASKICSDLYDSCVKFWVDARRLSQLLRGFRHAADAQKLAHPEKMFENKNF